MTLAVVPEWAVSEARLGLRAKVAGLLVLPRDRISHLRALHRLALVLRGVLEDRVRGFTLGR